MNRSWTSLFRRLTCRTSYLRPRSKRWKLCRSHHMGAAKNEPRSRVTQCLQTKRTLRKWFSSRLMRVQQMKDRTAQLIVDRYQCASRQGEKRESGSARDHGEQHLSCLLIFKRISLFSILGHSRFSILCCEYHGVARAAHQSRDKKAALSTQVGPTSG